MPNQHLPDWVKRNAMDRVMFLEEIFFLAWNICQGRVSQPVQEITLLEVEYLGWVALMFVFIFRTSAGE